MIHTRWFWLFNKKSNLFIWREICKRTCCPSIVTLTLLLFLGSAQRQKYIGSAGALLPGKLLRVRKVFARNIFFTLPLNRSMVWSFWKASIWSGKCPDCLESFWFFGKFLDCLECFCIVWKVSGLSWTFTNCP